MGNHNLKLIPFKNLILFNKAGNKIHIKKSHEGKFTDYCGGKVTAECIAKGKASSNPKIRKRATFAANARKWKHAKGGLITKAQDGTVLEFNSNANNTVNPWENLNKINSYYDYWTKNFANRDYLTVLKQQSKQLALLIDNVTNFGISLYKDIKNKKGSDPDNDNKNELAEALKEQDQTLGTPLPVDHGEDIDTNTSTQVDKKGGKIRKHLITKEHLPFGHKSILDDVGVVNEKTLKLK